MELLSFNQFINEGAYLGQDGLVHLQYADDRNNPAEVLKTADSGKDHFSGTQLSGMRDNDPSMWSWPIFWGLGPDNISPEIDHPGRIKYTMDKLKNGEIADMPSSLNDFIQGSFRKVGITRNFRPDYVVTVGSTAGLVNSMADAITQTLGSDTKIIELPKVVYFDAYDAFDWEEVNRQVDRNGKKTFDKAKSTIYDYVDKEQTPPELKAAIKASTTVDELKRAVAIYGIVWRDIVNAKPAKPFIVRSSGINSGGARSMWKDKYDYETTSFIDAVIDCAVNGSKMLIIDDNKHSGTDMRTIRRNVEEIVAGLDKKGPNADTRFAFYVLYRMPTKDYIDRRGEKHPFISTSQVVQGFAAFLQGGQPVQADDQIEDNLEEPEDK
jgi:hypothetical protein